MQPRSSSNAFRVRIGSRRAWPRRCRKGYGVPPTKFPREWFSAALYDAHLDRLEGEQAEDGGWPVAWEPPGPGSLAAWRAILTLEAIATLRANGRLD